MEDIIETVATLAAQLLKRQDQQREILGAFVEAFRLTAEGMDDVPPSRAEKTVSLCEGLPLNRGIPLPTTNLTDTVLIAVDGSQIVQTRHESLYPYWAIQVGVFLMSYARDYSTTSSTHFQMGVLDPNQGSDWVRQKRDLAEINNLTKAILDQPSHSLLPVGLLDNRLMYWPLSKVERTVDMRFLGKWWDELTAIRNADAIIAGYVDRPDAAVVISTIQALSARNEEDFSQVGNRPILDRDLFAMILGDGERSPLFGYRSQSADVYAEAGHPICSFYLNTGHGIARVDMPEWVACNPSFIEIVHHLIYDSCQVAGNGYPYPLMRADEIAVLKGEDATWIMELVQAKMSDLHGAMSPKHQSKELARAGKGRFT